LGEIIPKQRRRKMKEENKIIVNKAFKASKNCSWKVEGVCTYWRKHIKCQRNIIPECLYWNMPDCLKSLNIPDSVIKDIYADGDGKS